MGLTLSCHGHKVQTMPHQPSFGPWKGSSFLKQNYSRSKPKRIASRDSNRYLYTNIHTSTFTTDKREMQPKRSSMGNG